MAPARKQVRLEQAEQQLRAAALAYPGAVEEFPWGERVIKVAKKIFVFVALREGQLRVGVKLPASHEAAVMLPFAAPTGYGLGKSGWVSATFDGGQPVPVALLGAWMRESYLAIAPKKLVSQLSSEAPVGGAATPPSARKRRSAPK